MQFLKTFKKEFPIQSRVHWIFALLTIFGTQLLLTYGIMDELLPLGKTTVALKILSGAFFVSIINLIVC